MTVARVCCDAMALIATAIGCFAVARLALRNTTADFDRSAIFVAGAIWLPVLLYLITAALLRGSATRAVAVALAVSIAQVVMGLFFLGRHARAFREFKVEMIVAMAAVVVIGPLTYLVWRSFLQLREGQRQADIPVEATAQQPA